MRIPEPTRAGTRLLHDYIGGVSMFMAMACMMAFAIAYFTGKKVNPAPVV